MKKIIKNSYGVDLKEFESDTSYKNDQTKFRIIYTGVSIRKGILYLLEVFNNLELDNIELLIVGNIEKDLKKEFKKIQFK